MLFPDFLIIGPHRSGTTWLYANLKEHPQVVFPKKKEVHYFCEHRQLRPATCRESDQLSDYLKLFERSPIASLKKNLNALRRYGERPGAQVSGEATACYAMLEADTIQNIVALNPEIKIILMIRHPIDRTWSHARHFFDRAGRHISEVSESELKQFFKTKYSIPGGEYSKIIERWQTFVKEENLFIGFFHHLQSAPEQLLLNTFDFLGVRSDTKYIGSLARRKVNAVQAVKIPPRYRQLLETAYQEELSELSETFNLSW